MKILYLLPYPPWPLIYGDRLRNYYFIKRLIENYKCEVTIIAFNDKKAFDRKNAETIKAITKEIITVNRENIFYRIARCIKYFKKYPLRVSNYYSRKYTDKIIGTLKKENYDIIIVGSMHITINLIELGEIKDIPIVVDLIDSKSMLIKRRISISNKVLKIILEWEYKKIAKYEKRLSNEFNILLVCSEVDLKYLKEVIDTNNVYKTRNPTIYDNTNKSFSIKTRRNVKNIGFHGNISYSPNKDAIKYFVKNIYPKLSDIKGINYTFIGPGKVHIGPKRQNIKFTGKVDNINDELEKLDIYVSPLRYGSGLKYKIIEAMAAGLPIVCFQVSNDGINAKHNEDIILAETPDDFCKYVKLLVEDFNLRMKLSTNAAIFIKEYLRDEPVSQLYELLRRKCVTS